MSLPVSPYRGPVVADLPQLPTYAGVGERHEGDGQDEDDEEHVDLVQLVVHGHLPPLQAPERLHALAHRQVRLQNNNMM